jgi:hypothetical protein
MKQEISSNELLEVQIKNNNKILVNESLESTHTKGNFDAEPIGNLQVIVFYDGHFAAFPFRKDGNIFSCNIKVGNNDYSKNVFVVVTPQDDTYQYRITVLNQLQEVA